MEATISTTMIGKDELKGWMIARIKRLDDCSNNKTPYPASLLKLERI